MLAFLGSADAAQLYFLSNGVSAHEYHFPISHKQPVQTCYKALLPPPPHNQPTALHMDSAMHSLGTHAGYQFYVPYHSVLKLQTLVTALRSQL